MSHDELDTLEVLDEEEFTEEGQPLAMEEPEKIVVSKKARRGIRRLIDDVLEDQRLKAVLKGYEDNLQTNDAFFDSTVAD